MIDGKMGHSNHMRFGSRAVRWGVFGIGSEYGLRIYFNGGRDGANGRADSSDAASAGSAPKPVSAPAPAPAPVKQSTGITLPPPTIPIEQIIQKFAAKEAAFKEARGNYTYTQTVTVKDFEPTGEQAGQYKMVADIVFTPEGKRFENVTFAPMNTLVHLQLSPEDKRIWKIFSRLC